MFITRGRNFLERRGGRKGFSSSGAGDMLASARGKSVYWVETERDRNFRVRALCNCLPYKDFCEIDVCV